MLHELRRDCEQLHELSESLLEVRNKNEAQLLTIEQLTEGIQNFEEENRLLIEKNKTLEVFV
jgi:hypothetical protein